LARRTAARRQGSRSELLGEDLRGAGREAQRLQHWTRARGRRLVADDVDLAEALRSRVFPAILLLGGGRMDFAAYLVRAGPATAAIFAVVLLVVMRGVRPARGLWSDALSTRVSCAVIE